MAEWRGDLFKHVDHSTIVSLGAMDREIIGGLINSVSRYIHLAACQNMKSATMKGFGNMVGILKLLKVVLDEVLNSEMLIDEQLIEAAEKLDAMVNEAREIMERRPQRMSKICSVSSFIRNLVSFH